MAGHLLDAGYELHVFNRSQEAMNIFAGRGAIPEAGVREIAAACDVVITMLPDSPDVEQVALGQRGLIASAHPGLVYIDMSTIAPGMAVKVEKELGKLGVRCLDAPVSGGETGAINASLSIMVGGPEDLFREMLSIFQVMGNTITYCGATGTGQTVKACNQIQTALNMVAMSEALVLGAKAGVDPAVILKVLGGGYAQTRVMDVRGPKVIKGDFEPGFKSKFHYKDLNIIMETAKQLNVPLPATAIRARIVRRTGSLGTR